jgi:hypothetical protein
MDGCSSRRIDLQPSLYLVKPPKGQQQAKKVAHEKKPKFTRWNHANLAQGVQGNECLP